MQLHIIKFIILRSELNNIMWWPGLDIRGDEGGYLRRDKSMCLIMVHHVVRSSNYIVLHTFQMRLLLRDNINDIFLLVFARTRRCYAYLRIL